MGNICPQHPPPESFVVREVGCNLSHKKKSVSGSSHKQDGKKKVFCKVRGKVITGKIFFDYHLTNIDLLEWFRTFDDTY